MALSYISVKIFFWSTAQYEWIYWIKDKVQIYMYEIFVINALCWGMVLNITFSDSSRSSNCFYSFAGIICLKNKWLGNLSLLKKICPTLILLWAFQKKWHCLRYQSLSCLHYRNWGLLFTLIFMKLAQNFCPNEICHVAAYKKYLEQQRKLPPSINYGDPQAAVNTGKHSLCMRHTSRCNDFKLCINAPYSDIKCTAKGLWTPPIVF